MNIIKKEDFTPDYRHLLNAALNKETARLPLYDHLINGGIMDKLLNGKMSEAGDDRNEQFRLYCEFFKTFGYDAVIYEQCVGAVMPGSGALGGHAPGVIKTRDDFNKYPWAEIPDLYFKAYEDNFRLLGENMPLGMKAAGGIGNGVFECVQDIVGYMELCYIKMDDPELYADLFAKVGDMLVEIWSRFLKQFGDDFCICRFGDDLGFKSDTLLSHEDVTELILPQYKRVTSLVHSYNKPFLLHSCGQLFGVMDDIISIAEIDAKHSNEDVIAPFSEWVNKYGDKIGNFGGIDTDIICSDDAKSVKEYVNGVLKSVEGAKGIAIGTGNSVPDYASAAGYIAMNEAIREFRK